MGNQNAIRKNIYKSYMTIPTTDQDRPSSSLEKNNQENQQQCGVTAVAEETVSTDTIDDKMKPKGYVVTSIMKNRRY